MTTASAAALLPIQPEAFPNEITLPWPGQPWPGIEGAIYAGLCPGELCSAPYHLLLLADQVDALNWNAAMEWARSRGADLPTRNESAFLYAFHRHLFETDDWYWTGTQYSSGYAWYQYFSYGYQGLSYKKAEARVRAVRRFSSSVLQSIEANATDVAQAA